jgi:hypothetical protein
MLTQIGSQPNKLAFILYNKGRDSHLKQFIKEQQINLSLLSITLCLSIFVEVGEKFLQYAIIIKLTVIALLFVLCKCSYYIVSFTLNKSK